jgi:hypothetical protein
MPTAALNAILFTQPFPGAAFAMSFVTGKYQAGQGFSSFSGIPGVTFTRTGTAYSETSGGSLTLFGNNRPRITDKGLRIEESRTNSLTWSQDYTNAAWTKSNVTASGVVSDPAGGSTGLTVTASAGSAVHELTQSVGTITSAASYAASVFVKQGTHQYVLLNLQGTAGNWISVVFDLQALAATQTGTGATSGTLVGSAVTQYADGWIRLQMVGSLVQTSGTFAVGFAPAATGNSFSTLGEISFSAAGTEVVYLWGAQVELGGFPTSYIATTSGQATRSADAATYTAAALTGSVSIVVALDLGNTTLNTTEQEAFFWGAADTDLIAIFKAPTTNFASLLAKVGGVSMYAANSGVAVTGVTKWAVSFEGSSGIYRGAANGTSASASASGKTLPALSPLRFGQWISGGYLNGYIRSVVAYPYALSDTQLRAASA